MKGMRLCIATCVMLFTTLTLHGENKARSYQLSNLLILDTTEREWWIYKPTIDLLESVGITVSYKSLDTLIDSSPEQLALWRYKAVLFVFGTEFLSGIYRSHLSAKVMRLLVQYARLSGVMVGLVFPPLHAGPGINIIGQCAPIFDTLGFDTPRNNLIFPRGRDNELTSIQDKQRSIQAFCYVTNMFLSSPLESRPLLYHTSLHLPHAGLEFDLGQIDSVLQEGHHPLFLLPLYRHTNPTVKATLPYGLYWFNSLRKNHVFITNTSVLAFSSITENFNVCPVDFSLRASMLAMVQRMAWELSVLMRVKSGDEAIERASAIKDVPPHELPIKHERLHHAVEFGTGPMRDRAGVENGRAIAWMEIAAFEEVAAGELEKNPNLLAERCVQQDRLVDYLMRGGVRKLWITINPHMYWGKNGRLATAEKERVWLASLSLFTKKLHAAALHCKRPVPQIFIGFEITNNIYAPNMPKRHAIDVYENAYTDLPAPTDRTFWTREIIKPLERFAKAWKNPALSHGVPLGGIVLDLEMYCRQKTGTFLTTMGFDGQTFGKFIRSMHYQATFVALRDRALWLAQHNVGKQYFQFLEREAESIGRSMRSNFAHIIPGGTFMCYMPNLHVSWFYKGLCKGLTSDRQPLMLLTFNSEFFAHEQWFVANRIPARHATVLMLSKLQDTQSFGWVDYSLQHHHAFWFNRFSRFVEPKTRAWMSIEQPQMSEDLYDPFMDYVSER